MNGERGASADGEHQSFDPLTLRMWDIEASARERRDTFCSLLQTNVFAPLIQLGERGFDALMGVCSLLLKWLDHASESELADDYEEMLDDVALSCRAFAAIGSRVYGRLGSSYQDVEHFMSKADFDPSTFYLLREEAWWASMMEEHDQTLAATRELRPGMNDLIGRLQISMKTGCTVQRATALEAVRMLGQAKKRLRPTQADELEELARQAAIQVEEQFLTLMGDQLTDDIVKWGEGYLKVANTVFGADTMRVNMCKHIEEAKQLEESVRNTAIFARGMRKACHRP